MSRSACDGGAQAQAKASAQNGYTLIEMLVVLTLLSMAAYLFSNFIIESRKAAERGTAGAELLRRDLRSVANLRSGLQDCVELIANYDDVTADSMKGLRNVVISGVMASTTSTPLGSGAPAPVAFTGWPTVATSSEVDMVGPTSTAAADWGDEVMYVAQLNPITVTAYYTYTGGAWVAGGSGSSTATDAEILSVGRLQFVYDYLTLDPGTSIAGVGGALRLVEWRSQPYIDYASLSGLTNTPGIYSGGQDKTCCPRLTAACELLAADGYSLAFAPANVTFSATCSSCFYTLSGGMSNLSAAAVPVLATYSWAYLNDFDELESFKAQPGVDLGRVARANGGAGGESGGPSGYSVAFNTGPALTPLSVLELQGPGGALAVPAYAQADASTPDDDGGGPGFPAGFEVAIDGQYGSREIYLRLVLMVSNGGTSAPGIFQAQDEETEISVSPQYDF